MPLAALLLVLGAALCHSAWNLLVKTDARRLEIQSGALIVGVLLCSPVLLIYSLADVSRLAWGVIFVSGLFETAYVFALTAAYGAGDLSLVYPVARGTPPIFVVPLAIMLLGERPPWQGLAGIGLIVLGIYASHAGLAGSRVGRVNRRALALALLTGVFTACYSLVNKLGVSLVPVPLYAFLVFGVDAALIHLVRWVRGGLTLPLGRDAPWGRTVAVGVLMMAAYREGRAARPVHPAASGRRVVGAGDADPLTRRRRPRLRASDPAAPLRGGSPPCRLRRGGLSPRQPRSRRDDRRPPGHDRRRARAARAAAPDPARRRVVAPRSPSLARRHVHRVSRPARRRARRGTRGADRSGGARLARVRR